MTRFRRNRLNRASCLVIAAACALGGCGTDNRDSVATDARQRALERSEPGDRDSAARAPLPPDAGTARGHGADAGRVVVPPSEIDPPTARIVLGSPGDDRTLAQASQPGSGHVRVVALDEPRLTATATGEDHNEGVARVRVSLAQEIRCRRRDGTRFVRRRVRYRPPPQVERIRSRPGIRLATRRRRSLRLSLATRACGRAAEVSELHGELWVETINGSGLEAVTPHIRFQWRGEAAR